MLVGKTLGKYRITAHIGSGGMSEVYKAYQPGLDRYVAVKVLHPFLAQERDFLTRFQREAKFAAMLRHPNIVQVYDFDHDDEDNAYYMVMELIEGPSLKVRMQDLEQDGKLLPGDETISVVTSVANALEYAHQHGTVHRDVKPANIMFSGDKQVILTDFGIAKMVNTAALTASGAMVGTPAYMAPEQGLGKAGDERADIYSLGVVLYQLATGHLPFQADTPLGIALKHINAPLPPPTPLNPDLPPSIDSIIMRTLAKKPEDRYQSASAVMADLKRIAAGHRVEPPPPEILKVPTADEMATLPSAPAIRLPATRRGWWRAILNAVAPVVILTVALVALFASGAGARLLNAFGVQLATPSSGEATPDALATHMALSGYARATADAQATLEATLNATLTPNPTPTPDLTATAYAACDFDLTVVSDPAVWPRVLVPRQSFLKRWQIENTGTCAWPEDAQLAHATGYELEVVTEPEVEPLQPGEAMEVRIIMRAPGAYNAYSSVWRLVDGAGNTIGDELEISCVVGATPTPRATSTPTVEPTLPSQLRMTIPVLAWCDEFEREGRINWGAQGGYSAGYRYFFSSVAPEHELPIASKEFDQFAHTETYFTTAGELTFPVPGDCCQGDSGHYQGDTYEIVWWKVFIRRTDCP